MKKQSVSKEGLMHLQFGMTRLPSPEVALQWFEALEAGWVHNGDPKMPHVILNSGRHSNGFFLCKKVLKFGWLREMLAMCIIRNLRKEVLRPSEDFGMFGGVFGAPDSSTCLAADVARFLRIPFYQLGKTTTVDGKKEFSFKADDHIPENTLLLQIEELITKSDSAENAAATITTSNPFPVRIFPVIGALVWRPESLAIPAPRQICAHIVKEVPSWDSNKFCPLCSIGSEAIFPKGENWARLVS